MQNFDLEKKRIIKAIWILSLIALLVAIKMAW